MNKFGEAIEWIIKHDHELYHSQRYSLEDCPNCSSAWAEFTAMRELLAAAKFHPDRFRAVGTPKERTYTQQEADALVAGAYELAMEHRFSIGLVTVGCSCGWYVSIESADSIGLWKEHLRSILIPANACEATVQK